MPQALIQLSSTIVAILPSINDGQGSSSVTVNIGNSVNRILVTNGAANSRSNHEFTVNESRILGFGAPTNFSMNQCTAILAIACSLLSVDDIPIFFSATGEAALVSIFEDDNPAPSPAVIRPSGIQTDVSIEIQVSVEVSVNIGLRTTLSLDEQEVVNLCGRIVKLNPFDQANRHSADLNMIEALSSYGRAIQSTDPVSAYTRLSEALEKIVNRNAQSTAIYLQGQAYENAVAAQLNIVSPQDVHQLKECYNRFKHGVSNASQQTALEDCKQDIGVKLRLLAALTNRAFRQFL